MGVGPMIDKVDVQIPGDARPGPVLAHSIAQLRKYPVPPFRSSRHYQFICDLREPFETDAVVHLYLRHGRSTHKVEIIDAGEKCLSKMENIITGLFEVDPRSLRLMRVDLAADIEEVPVSWFRGNAFVKRKQFSSRIEKSRETELEFVAMAKATVETVYAGKRPNLIRIYDKFGEWNLQAKKQQRIAKRFNAQMDKMGLSDEQKYYGARAAPTLEQFCSAHGYTYRPGDVLTRIERQIGGGRFPDVLRTFGDLYSAAEYQPFDAIELHPRGTIVKSDCPPSGVSVRNWLAARGFEALIEQFGSAQLARAAVLKHGSGNGKRILEAIDKCARESRAAVTIDEIHESFRKSTLRQSSQSPESDLYLTPTYERQRQTA